MSDTFEDWFAFAAAYENQADAEADFMSIKDAKAIGLIGKYQSAVFTKQEDGKIKVLNTDSTTRATGAKWGAATGAVLAILFPAGLLAGLAWGAGFGAIVGNFGKGWHASDIKQLADTLDAGESGVVLVAEATPDVAAKRILKMAAKAEKKQIDADAKEIEAAIDQQAG